MPLTPASSSSGVHPGLHPATKLQHSRQSTAPHSRIAQYRRRQGSAARDSTPRGVSEPRLTTYGPLAAAGAHDIDEHFRTAPFEENLPVLMGLLGVWNISFLGYPCRAILPYAQALSKLAPHIQQVTPTTLW